MADTDVILSVQKIKPGKTDRLREWWDRDEEVDKRVKEPLREEGIMAEASFVEHRDDGDYLLYYIEVEDFDEAMETFLNSDDGHIQRYHDIVEETLVGGLDEYHSNLTENMMHIRVD